MESGERNVVDSGIIRVPIDNNEINMNTNRCQNLFLENNVLENNEETVGEFEFEEVDIAPSDADIENSLHASHSSLPEMKNSRRGNDLYP